MFHQVSLVVWILGLLFVGLPCVHADLIMTTWPINSLNCPSTVVPYSLTFVRVNFCYLNPQTGMFQMTTCNPYQYYTVAYNDPMCSNPNQTLSQGALGCQGGIQYACGQEPMPPWTDFSITQYFDGPCGPSNLINVTLVGVGCFANTSDYAYYCDSNQTTLQTVCPRKNCSSCIFSSTVYQIGCVNTTRTVCTANGVVPPLVLYPTTFLPFTPSTSPSISSKGENALTPVTSYVVAAISLLSFVFMFIPTL
jgi:hypothetical protein